MALRMSRRMNGPQRMCAHDATLDLRVPATISLLALILISADATEQHVEGTNATRTSGGYAGDTDEALWRETPWNIVANDINHYRNSACLHAIRATAWQSRWLPSNKPLHVSHLEEAQQYVRCCPKRKSSACGDSPSFKPLGSSPCCIRCERRIFEPLSVALARLSLPLHCSQMCATKRRAPIFCTTGLRAYFLTLPAHVA